MVAIDVLQSLQELYLADDIEIPAEATLWSAEEAERFFESGGQLRPKAKAAADGNTVDISEKTASGEEDEEFMRKRMILAKAAGLTMPIATPSPSPPTPPQPRFGTFRWLVDISTWEPTHNEWQLLLSQLPEEDASKVTLMQTCGSCV